MVNGVLFDIGGVLVALDGAPRLAQLMGVELDRDRMHALWTQAPSVVAHETGRMSASEFAERAVLELGLSIGPDAFLREFEAWPVALQPGALELLDELPATLRKAALSNSCELFWRRVQTWGLRERFEHVYLSHEIGHLKPQPQAYLVALGGMNLAAEEVLFLDDSRANVQAARDLGLRAEVATDPMHARQVLHDYGLL
jgi:HAD superfamily hydrolase (TIGR01509 family)